MCDMANPALHDLYEESKNILSSQDGHKYIQSYVQSIQHRKLLHYWAGLAIRWKKHLKYALAVNIARKRGAIIGEGVVMPLGLALKANRNLNIGSHTSIQTDKIDTRSPVRIGNFVIIGENTEIITTSHDIDSPRMGVKHYGIDIGDYVWLPTDIMVLPSCRKIGRGAVVGSGSVVVKNVEPMSVVSGNPAISFKQRRCVHSGLVVEALLGGDYSAYRQARKGKLKLE